ncbi:MULTISPECIES: hypothetical protein [Mycobacterium avium complex (MAC)]|uniref:Uncharacterized protein n=1 Tax=Mycobacterium avium (strain 104) TaxID=243243 RepID=A0A0H2ZSE3_MYCA1|nr:MULTISPECIES: hypothetical protein [Mycobacterium avium complex (MAC)]ABK64609.1 conserved hypothetical protein [Mycobacterium avium 104]EUA41880.1 hypothetical protein I549_0484 [Mycobacterium avium subsp. avium 2285 (R)]
MPGLPTLSEVRAANWDHLRTNAAAWRSLGRTWESAFTEVHNASLRPGGTDWTGAGAEAFQDRAYLDLVKIRHPADITDTVAGIAERGADAQDGNKRSILDTVDEVEGDNFQVGEDWSVTDRITWYSSAAELEQREQAAQEHRSFLMSKVYKLVGDEADISRNLTTASADLHGFSFGDEGADGGAGDGQPHVVLVDDVHRDPTIKGPAATPQHEQNGYDLQDQFQDGQGPVFGGDPRDGVPRSPASELAQGPPGTRPLPTGTALGPDGHRYAFFSHPDGTEVPGVNQFVTNGAVWDYTDPAHPVKVGDLPGIYQASGVYDAATNQMVIVGNTSNRNGDLTRGMWVSGPIDPAQPNSWISSLQHVGDVSLPGDRESQLVALSGGGYMLVGATNGGPVQAISAATPQGLMGAAPQTLLSQGQLPTVYGPTVMGTSLDPATGVEQIQLRVSTWPPGPTYDPNTWTTTFDVQH